MSTTLFFTGSQNEKKPAEYEITKKVDGICNVQSEKIINGKNVKRIIKYMLSHGIGAVRLYSHIVDSSTNERSDGIVYRERAENVILFYSSANYCAVRMLYQQSVVVDSTKYMK